MQFNMEMIGLNILMYVWMAIMRFGRIELKKDVGKHTGKQNIITDVRSLVTRTWNVRSQSESN